MGPHGPLSKKPRKNEPFRFNQMTKAELIKTIKALDKRQTKLLNELAKMQALVDAAPPCTCNNPNALVRFPWEASK